MITNRGAALLLAATCLALGVAADRALPSGPAPVPTPGLVRYEDGSGVLYIGDQEVRTFPADTFVWDCHTMGNLICGDVDDGDIG